MKNTSSVISHVQVSKRPAQEKSVPMKIVTTTIPQIRQISSYLKPSHFPWSLAFFYKFIQLTDAPSLKLEVEDNTPKEVIKHYLKVNEQRGEIFAESTVGIQHRQAKERLPCQDAATATIQPRPILIVCDGAGSAAVSDLGSQALCTQLTRFCQSLEPILAQYLDVTTDLDITLLKRIIVRHAMGVLQDLATYHRRSIRDFRSTLNIVIVGSIHIFWLRVGDGEIVQERLYLNKQDNISAEYCCLGEQSKGEFSNQTIFIDDQLNLKDVECGVLATVETTGLILMSDGCSEKLISTQRNRVAGQVTQWLQHLRQQKLKMSDIYKRFYSEDFLKQSTGDDRSIALYSRQYCLPN